jgi:hypothetical protein
VGLNGLISLGDCNCDFVSREAKYTILGEQEFDGSAILGNAKFNVELRNDEEQAAKFKINMRCNTAKNFEYINSEERYIQPKSTEIFPMEYNVGWLEDWKCNVSSVDSEIISTCENIA